jgi:3-hydroxybutyryl-CoA dehydrogenase
MGAGVAQSFAVAGYPVRLQDIAEAALTRGKGAIKKSLEPKARDAALQRIALTTRIDDFADCDVVVEAVLERFDVKKAVMENLDGVCRPETIRATNTSSIPVTRIARSPPECLQQKESRPLIEASPPHGAQ